MTGRRPLLLAAALALAGCAAVVPPQPPAGPPVAGRIAIVVDADGATPARSLTAQFELRGSPEHGALDLSTPLGSLLAQARWSPAGAELNTPQRTATYANVDLLAEQLLGERIPVPALFDWLRGRPWSGAPSVPASPPAQGFVQLGWDVDLSRFGAEAQVLARRAAAPAVTVRARLDPR